MWGVQSLIHLCKADSNNALWSVPQAQPPGRGQPLFRHRSLLFNWQHRTMASWVPMKDNSLKVSDTEHLSNLS